jgi:hypothetical protein
MNDSRRPVLLKIIAVSALIFALIAGWWVFYWIKYIHPVDVFRAQEVDSIPHFDALNQSVLGELPSAPQGVKLISQGTGGILSPTNLHGRRLVLKYVTNFNASLTSNTIVVLYENALIPKGWEESASPFGADSSLFVRNTGCIELVILVPANEYDVYIWHDFLSQDFSPTLPPPELLRMRDYGETEILTCPPK